MKLSEYIKSKNRFSNPHCMPAFLTIFPSIKQVFHHKKFYGTWGQAFSEHTVLTDKKDAQVFMTGFLNPKNGAGRRCNEDVISKSALVYDLDGLDFFGYLRLLQFVEQVSIIIMTSYSHFEVPGVFRLRIIMPLSRIVNPVEFERIHEVIDPEIKAISGLAFDDCSSTLSQGFYFPSCPAQRAEHAFVKFQAGYLLSVPDLLGNKISESNCRRNSVAVQAIPISWDKGNLEAVLSGCVVLKQLLCMAIDGRHLNHGQRRIIGQALVSLNMPEKEMISFFSKQENFREEITKRSLRSLRYSPSCKTISSTTRLCNANCSKIAKIGARTPIRFSKTIRENRG